MCTWQKLFEASLDIQEEPVQDALEAVPASRGVLLYTDSRQRPVQILTTANLRRLITGRMEQNQTDTLTRRANIAAIAAFVHYRPIPNDFRARLFYNEVVNVCFPDKKADWLDLPKQHFVLLDKTQKCPCFQIVEKPEFFKKKDRYLYGLFPTRKAADHFCHVLNTVHELCRNPSIACTPKAKTCSYFQMNLCSGYCMGKISRQTYFGHVEKAIYFSSHSRRSLCIENLKSQMNHLGLIKEYEKAQRVKNKIKLLQSLDSPRCHWTGLLHAMDILHMDRSDKIDIKGRRKKQQTYDLFRISWNCIHILENVLSENLEDAVNKSGLEPDQKLELTKEQILDHLATISWFLYRKNSKGLWTRNKPVKDLLKQIHETFPETAKNEQKKDAEQNPAS